MNKKAFTLIELLLVITIIVIVTTSGTFYFFKFLDSKNINSNIEIIKNDLLNIDKKVVNYEIFDYELVFETWSLWYISYLNKFDNINTQSINFNFNTWTWVISTNATETWWIRILNIFKKYKLFKENILDSKDVYTGSFTDSEYYKITWNIYWKELNSIYIKYYIENNVFKEKENYLILDSIYSDINKTYSCNKLIINNIWWKKNILCWNTPVNKAYLFFSQNWIEWYIEINK